MTDKLVERLRKIPLYEGHGEPSSLPEDAADALEAQQARIVELEELAKGWQKIALHHTGHENPSMAFRHLLARIRALEEALRPFAKEAGAWVEYEDCEPLVESFPDYYGSIRVCDLRRAKQVMEGQE